MRKILLFVFLALNSLILFGQGTEIDSLSKLIKKADPDSNKVKLQLELSAQFRRTDLSQSLAKSEDALQLSKTLGYDLGTAEALKSIGLIYYFQGNFADALIQWQRAQVAYEKNGNATGVANILSNMGAIYHNQSEYGKAIDLYLQSLHIAEKIGDTIRVGTVLQNIGAVHLEKGEAELALEAYQKVLPLFEALNYAEGIGLAYLHIGEIYFEKDSVEQSILYFKKAIPHLEPTPYYPTLLRSIGEVILKNSNFKDGMPFLDSAYNVAYKSGDEFELARILNAIATAHEKRGDNEKALTNFERAKSLVVNGDLANFELRMSAIGLVRIYTLKGDFKRALENQKLYQSINDSIYNLESDKKIDGLLFNFELDKKESAIELLVKDQKIQEIELSRQKGIRNGFIAGFILVLLFAGVFFIQRNRIGKEKQRSEELLLNILPAEVADELKEKGHSDAQLIDQVTVLFTDFKGFTALSEQVTPKELVADLHECFSQFDRICEKYGIEKIKTIGDAYMAAGGLPTPNQTHATDVVKAALDMAKVVEEGKAKKQAAGEPFFEIRIGIHTGPVVAGIVGVKKFQYDIWGDTVNTASRMESSGEVGKVNISEATYKLLKDDDLFSFSSRGRIEAKGKGELAMFFVEATT